VTTEKVLLQDLKHPSLKVVRKNIVHVQENLKE